jgi:hypothetical protein
VRRVLLEVAHLRIAARVRVRGAGGREPDHVRFGRATVSPNLRVASPRARAADAYGHVRSPAGVIPALRFEGHSCGRP